VRRIATTIATIGFFVLAIVGMATGVPPLVCGVRAVVGAVALFVIVMVGGRLALTVVADAFVTRISQAQNARKESDEPRD
jgi:hypothetical protein